jgi:hypothetical protein
MLTQEVSDFYILSVVDDVDVDGKVSIDKSHLVLVANGNALDHILDVGAHGSDGGQVFSVSVVHNSSDLVLFWTREFDIHVVERLLQLTTWALDFNRA